MTFLVALGSNLSALWILIANGWMQNPVGAEFNLDTMRMELTSFADLFFNPVARPEVRAHAWPRATSRRRCSCSASRRGTC